MRIKINCPLSWIVLLFLSAPVFAQTPRPATPKVVTPKKKITKDSTAASVDPFAEKIKGCRKTEGLFTIYQDTVTGSVNLYVKNDQVGKEFIYQSFSMGGPAELFLNQNMIRETWVFTIQKKFNKVEFARQNTSFYYDKASALSKAANVDISQAIFYSDTAAAKDSKGFLLNVDGLMLSDKLDYVKPSFPLTLPPNAYFNLGGLNPAKSGYDTVRSFPKNTDIAVSLAYDNPQPFNYGGRDITDARYVRVKMQHSFIAMPENDYRPRMDDPRIGYFTQERDDLTTNEILNYSDMIIRWHLVKKDPAAALSEPVEPIVWWIENTTPVEYRDIIKHAGEKWNEAFEKAGFKNAVVMKQMPDNADWDPSDIRYNVIRWVSSNLGYAIGPCFVNPRTGQILGADITIDWGLMVGGQSEEDLFSAFTHPLQNNTNTIADKKTAMKHHWQHCAIAKGLRSQINMGVTTIELLDENLDDLKTLREQFLTMLILHEMGHTMGLNHNMKASYMLSPEELTKKEITRKLGTMGSVMDYDIVNLNADREKQGDYYTTKTGPYDWWAIQYGYTPFTAADEKAGLSKIAARSTDPQLIFGNDADITWMENGIDPRVMTWDMSNDVIKYSEDRFSLANKLVSKIKDRYTKQDKSYGEMRQKYFQLNSQRHSMVVALSAYVGGVYVDRSFAGQAKDAKPFSPVSTEQQRKAVATISQYIFAPNAFESDQQLFPYLQQQRRGFNFFGATEDPKLSQLVLGLQMSALSHMLHPVTLQRVNNSTLYGNAYNTAELMNDLVQGVFADDLKTTPNVFRMNLQTEFVKSLAYIVNTITVPFDNASRSSAQYNLTKVKTMLQKASSESEQAKAHRSNLVFLIDRALATKTQ